MNALPLDLSHASNKKLSLSHHFATSCGFVKHTLRIHSVTAIVPTAGFEVSAIADKNRNADHLGIPSSSLISLNFAYKF